MSGKLYVVATPIGNLADFSQRAISILQQVDLIAAEDTRHSKMLLQHYAISNKVMSLHQHNEDKVSQGIIQKLIQGEDVAVVSDAGTPLLSDPGLPLVQLAREQGIDVTPVPGACALIAALSVAGLPLARFIFEGFLPRTASARKAFFKHRQYETSTWVFYESSHRIQAAMQDMLEVIPRERQVVVARELTKLHETIVKDSLENVCQRINDDDNMRKGEFVVIVQGAEPLAKEALSHEDKRILDVLLKQCSTKTAAALAADITGQRKKLLYQAALQINEENTRKS